MTRRIHSTPLLFSRREVRTLGAAFGAPALGIAPVRAASTPVLTRPLPRTGERLAVVGLGTAIIFDIGTTPPVTAGSDVKPKVAR